MIFGKATAARRELRFKSDSRLHRYDAAFSTVAASGIEKRLGTEGMCPRAGGVPLDESA